MRAPDTEPPLWGYFSEGQWQEIKAYAERGVDLDSVKVGEFVAGKRWWSPDDSATAQRPVRKELQSMATYYGFRAQLRLLPKEGVPPTPLEQAKNWQKRLAAIESALNTIYRTEMAYPVGDLEAGHEVRLAEIGDEPVCREMHRRIVEVKDRIAQLEAEGAHRNQNARTIHSEYWNELTRLWIGITGGLGPKRRQCLARFLVACTPSWLFPDIPAQELKPRISHFLSNRSRSRQ